MNPTAQLKRLEKLQILPGFARSQGDAGLKTHFDA
jgi:hypothetical protein